VYTALKEHLTVQITSCLEKVSSIPQASVSFSFIFSCLLS
jgi:hypothetical protein